MQIKNQEHDWRGKALMKRAEAAEETDEGRESGKVEEGIW